MAAQVSKMKYSIEFGKEKIENAKIKFTQSGIGENDNLAMLIGFELSESRTVFTNKFDFDSEKMKNILNVLEVRNWEELPKKYARVCILNEKVVKIGNILNNKWVKL